MKSLIPAIFSLILFSTQMLKAQQELAPEDIPSNFEFEWLKQFQSPAEHWPLAMLNKIAKTQDGNFVLAGVFADEVTYDGEVFSGDNESHPTIFQIDPAGNVMWEKSLHDLAPDCWLLVDMVIGTNGDIYVLGVENSGEYWLPVNHLSSNLVRLAWYFTILDSQVSIYFSKIWRFHPPGI